MTSFHTLSKKKAKKAYKTTLFLLRHFLSKSLFIHLMNYSVFRISAVTEDENIIPEDSLNMVHNLPLSQPRLIKSHLSFDMLPSQLIEKKSPAKVHSTDLLSLLVHISDLIDLKRLFCSLLTAHLCSKKPKGHLCFFL